MSRRPGWWTREPVSAEEGRPTTPGTLPSGSGGELPDVRANLARVLETIARAARRAGRRPEDVRLVAVTKGIPADLVRLALTAGVTEVGENRVQEGEAKRLELGPSHPEVKWHLIGHLQTNKAARAARRFDLIHSVDSLRLAEALSAAVSAGAAGAAPVGARGGGVDVLLQVNVSGEVTKFGVAPAETAALARAASRLPGLRVRGLMTIAPLVDDPEKTRPIFRALAALAREIDRLALPGVTMEFLSMGMSQDYEVAVTEGANLVRIGTAIFGPRRG